jgi:hypothetical protein
MNSDTKHKVIFPVEPQQESLDLAFEKLKFRTESVLCDTFEIKKSSKKREFSILKKKLMLEISMNATTWPRSRSKSAISNTLTDAINCCDISVTFQEFEHNLSDKERHNRMKKKISFKTLGGSENDPYDSDVSMDICELYNLPKRRELFSSFDSSLSDIWTSPPSDIESNSKNSMTKSFVDLTETSHELGVPKQRCNNSSTFQPSTRNFEVTFAQSTTSLYPSLRPRSPCKVASSSIHRNDNSNHGSFNKGKSGCNMQSKGLTNLSLNLFNPYLDDGC